MTYASMYVLAYKEKLLHTIHSNIFKTLRQRVTSSKNTLKNLKTTLILQKIIHLDLAIAINYLSLKPNSLRYGV